MDGAGGTPTLAHRWPRWHWLRWAWLWPTLLSLVLGLVNLGRPELWRDELRSWSAASRSLPDLFHLLGNTDAAVALYYLLLHFWLAVFGDSAVALRLPSTLAMAGATAVVVLIARRLLSRRTGIVAGLVFALIPAVSRFAQETRPYALTMLLVSLATLLLLRALERPTWGRFVGYGLALTAVCLMQVVATPIVLAHALGVWLWHGRSGRVWLRAAVGAVLGLALASPIIVLSQSQYGRQVGSLPPAALRELFEWPQHLFFSGPVAGAVIILGLLACAERRPSPVGGARPLLFLVGWALLPIAAIWGVSRLGSSYWLSRYLLFTLPAFAILAAATVAALRRRLVVVALVVLAALGLPDQLNLRQVGAHDQWDYPTIDAISTGISYSAAAQVIADSQRPGDAIVYSARQSYWLLDIGIAYHLRGREQPRDLFVSSTALSRGDFWPTECLDPASCVGDATRVWVITVDPSLDPLGSLEPDKEAALRDFTVAATWHPSGLIVQLRERDR